MEWIPIRKMFTGWLIFSVCPNFKGTEFIVLGRILIDPAKLWNNRSPEWMIYGFIIKEIYCLKCALNFIFGSYWEK